MPARPSEPVRDTMPPVPVVKRTVQRRMQPRPVVLPPPVVEEVAEWRLEVVVPEGKVDAAVAALRAAHSYEEPAFDVYPLRPAKAGRGL